MAHLPLLVLSREDVLQSISMSETIGLMKTAFIALASGNAQVPIRAHLHLDAQDLMVAHYVYEQARKAGRGTICPW